MLTLMEKKKLREMIQSRRGKDVSQQPRKEFWRLRDEKGRFRSLNGLQMEEFPSESLKLREIKLVKQKDTYGTYWVQKRWLTDGDKEVLIITGIIVIMAIIF